MPRACAREGGANLVGDVQGALGVERAFGDQIAQARTLDVFEHQKERAVVELAEIGRRGDIGVLDVSGRHRLALEARDNFGHPRHLGVQHLDREPLVHEHVLGEVDRSHPALAENRFDSVAIG